MIGKAVIAFCFGIATAVVATPPNNVCKTFKDYYHINTSSNCYYNPDITEDIFQIVTSKGYPLVQYETKTDDGYILPLYRIPNHKPRGVVFLQHPLSASPICWVDKGNSSLAFMLAAVNYDVWLGSARGNALARKHVNLTPEQPAFWDFSFHEIGVNDLPVQIDFVKKMTGRGDIVYVGHSMATTSALVYASMMPKHAESSVSVFICLSPTANIPHNTSPVIRVFQGLWNEISKTVLEYGMQEVIPYGNFTKGLLKLLCLTYPPTQSFCALGLLIAGGWSPHQLNPEWMPIELSHNPSGVTFKALNHYMQTINSGYFQMYDYGPETNTILYNSETPPNYPLKDILAPFYFIYGTADTAANPTDTLNLYYNLPKRARPYGAKRVEGLNHFDLSYGKNIREYIYLPILRFLDTVVFKQTG